MDFMDLGWGNAGHRSEEAIICICPVTVWDKSVRVCGQFAYRNEFDVAGWKCSDHLEVDLKKMLSPWRLGI